MKKTILTILITAIVCITGTVIASNYLASEIVYNDTTVDQALDELYSVHETYKNLTSDTTVTPDKLLEGITAYNKNGELVTGTYNNHCIKGSFVCNSDCISNTGIELADFMPSQFFLYDNSYFVFYAQGHNNKAYYYDNYSQAYYTITDFYIKNNKFVIHDWSNSFSNRTINYIACK